VGDALYDQQLFDLSDAAIKWGLAHEVGHVHPACLAGVSVVGLAYTRKSENVYVNMEVTEMAEKTPNAAADLSLNELQALNPKTLQDLHEKYGLEVQIRSNSAAVNQILTSLGKIGPQAAFQRGFDRTSPGYDKYYNRDFLQGRPGEDVINPAMPLQEALKTLTAEQLVELKKSMK
jgi:hypothetical protein